MARGNNGNLLQHFTECEIARYLTKEAGASDLHVVFTHAMAPCEPFEEERNTPHLALDACLLAAKLDESGELGREFAVVEAYRRTEASADGYPNSAELVARIVGGRKKLHGLLCETCAAKRTALAERWSRADVCIHPGSWREANLKAPTELERPWLFTMDPFTFTQRSFSEAVDDGNLDASDLHSVKDSLSGYLQAPQPGALCVFCYSLRPPMPQVYRCAIDKAFGKLDIHVRFVETCAGGGNRHIGALLSQDVCLLEAVEQRWQDLFSRLSKKS